MFTAEKITGQGDFYPLLRVPLIKLQVMQSNEIHISCTIFFLDNFKCDNFLNILNHSYFFNPLYIYNLNKVHLPFEFVNKVVPRITNPKCWVQIPNLLRTRISYMVGGGGGESGTNFWCRVQIC